MAEVWKGVRRVGVGNAEKTVAIKLIASHAALDPGYQRMFMREARVSLLLSHANIAQVFDVDVDRETKQLYMAMEYVHGLNLHQFMRRLRGEAMPHPMIGYVIGEVLRGLTYAHEAEKDGENIAIVHRDISPHNIMVSTSGEVKITDFGIASIATEATTGTIKGKLQYMPPEQLLGDSRNPTVDLFSVGAVLHELIEGKPFRSAVDSARMYGMILSGDKPDLQRADVPAGLRVLRDRLLEVDTAKRAPSARLALEYLYRWDGYRNASLDLGKLVKELLLREDDFDPPEPEADIRTEQAPASLLLESQISTERPQTPESRIPTEQPTSLDATRATTLIAAASPPAASTALGVSFPRSPKDDDRARSGWPILVISALAIVALVIGVSGSLAGWWSNGEAPAAVVGQVEQPVEPIASVEPPALPSTTDRSEPAKLLVDEPVAPEPLVAEPPNTKLPSPEPPSMELPASKPSGTKRPNSKPVPIAVTLMVSSGHEPPVEFVFKTESGREEAYEVAGPERSAKIEIRPGEYYVRYRHSPAEDWNRIGRVTVPSKGPVRLELNYDKLRLVHLVNPG